VNIPPEPPDQPPTTTRPMGSQPPRIPPKQPLSKQGQPTQPTQPNQSPQPPQPTPPSQPTHTIIWANDPDPTFKQQWQQAWQQAKLSIQTGLANNHARQQFAQYQATAYETVRGNGNCPNCGSPNVTIGTHSDGGSGCMMGIGVLVLLFCTCGLGLILMALSTSRKSGRFCRCMYCGQQWSA